MLPTDSVGRVFWKKVPGFEPWFRKIAVDLNNPEIAEAVLKKYGVSASIPMISNMRRNFHIEISPEAMRRALLRRQHIVIKDGQRIEDTRTPQEKLEASMLRQQLQTLTKRQTFYEMVGEKIIEAVRQIPSLPPVHVPKIVTPKGLSEEEAVLVISDVQAGLTTSHLETGGLGEFNSQVLIEEIDYLGATVETIMRYYPNIKKLHVWFNGDIVEGNTIFFGQAREVDMNVAQQVLFSVEYFARLLHRLSARFEQVMCGGVVGNHGRIGMKGELSPMANFDYLVYKWLEERTRPLPNVAWNIPETWWQVHEVQKYRFLCVHGDDTGVGTWGIPFYAIARHKHKYQEMLRRSGLTPIDYMIVGHHSEKAQFNDIICAGSWPGGTEFSIKRMQAMDIPTAPFFGVHKSHGVTWRRDLQLRPLRAR